MMRHRSWPAWAFALAGVFAVATTPDAASAQRRARVASVEITPAEAAIQVGQQQVFVPIAYDVSNNPIATATFTFTSSNSRVATVDANGIATGASAGTVTITARTGTGTAARRATATLTVSAATQPVQQAVTVTPGDARPVPPPVVGVRPAGPGTASFANQPDGTGAAEGLIVNPLRLVLVRGESRQLEYRSVGANGGAAEKIPIVFSITPGGERFVTVDSMGMIRAAGDTGRATVRVETPLHPAIPPKQVTVEVSGDSVRFARTEVWLSPEQVDTLDIRVPGQNRSLDVRGQFQFASSDTTKVRVSPLAPIVTAVAPGSARITGDNGFHSLSVPVSVYRRVVRIAGTPVEAELTVAMSSSTAFTVQALAADSTPVPEAPLRWTLPDTSIARFDTATMTLRGIRMGQTRLAVAPVSARDSGLARSWRITVVAGGLAASRTRLGLGVGDRAPVAVRLLDDRRQPIGPATGLRWTSTNDSVARYVEGNVVGVGVGHARLTARTAWDSTVSLDAYIGGQLLVPAQRGGRWDLYAMTADSVPRFSAITSDAAVELEPAWSPDLTRIAFVMAPPGLPANYELFVANADGTEPRRLTFDSATVGSPVFVRPGGNSIVFQSSRGGRPQIHVVGLDGTGRRQITSGESPNTAPDVSPDGTRLLFVSLRQVPGSPRNYDIFQMNLDGTGERRLTSSPRTEDSPLYAADGQTFYFLRDEGGRPPSKRVYRQSLTDTAAVAQPITPAGMFVQAYSVNPDGSLLVLTRLESVRGVGDVPRVVLFRPETGTAVDIQVGAGEQLSAPVFRPATPRPPQ